MFTIQRRANAELCYIGQLMEEHKLKMDILTDAS